MISIPWSELHNLAEPCVSPPPLAGLDFICLLVRPLIGWEWSRDLDTGLWLAGAGLICLLVRPGTVFMPAPPFTREINPWWLRLPVDTPDQSEASIQASWSLLTNQIPVDTPDWTPEHRWHEKLIHYPKLGLTFIQGVDSLQAKTHDAHFPIKV